MPVSYLVVVADPVLSSEYLTAHMKRTPIIHTVHNTKSINAINTINADNFDN